MTDDAVTVDPQAERREDAPPTPWWAGPNRVAILIAIAVAIVLAFAAVTRLRSDSSPVDITDAYIRTQPGPQPLFDVPTEFGASLHIENGKLAGGAGDATAQANLLSGAQTQLLRNDLNGDGFDELVVNLTVPGQDPGFFVVQSFEQSNRVVLEGRGTMAITGTQLTQTTVTGSTLVWKAQSDSRGRIFGFARATG